MDDRRFDSLTRALATRADRRSALKGWLGAGSAAAVAVAMRSSVHAARRGHAGPQIGGCPRGYAVCGGGCCPTDAGPCCNGVCCIDGQCVNGDCCRNGVDASGQCCPDSKRACDGDCIGPGECCYSFECPAPRGHYGICRDHKCRVMES